MLVKVAKEFRWEMGHRLPYHETCRNIHGHSYRMIVEIVGEVDETGMVIDFGEIACLVKPILSQLDHSFMVDSNDALMLKVLSESALKKTEVPFFSTAENIARWILVQIGPRLFERKSVSSVTLRLYETSNSSVEVNISK